MVKQLERNCNINSVQFDLSNLPEPHDKGVVTNTLIASKSRQFLNKTVYMLMPGGE
jgi:hypothetical protein